MNLKEAAQQAMDFIVDTNKNSSFWLVPESNLNKVITALRTALAEDAMQRLTDVQQEIKATSQQSRQVEPVAYVTGYSKGYATVRPIDPCLLMPVGMALYRSPPKRKPLTDEEIESCIDEDFEYGLDRGNISNKPVIRFARALERAHGIGGEE